MSTQTSTAAGSRPARRSGSRFRLRVTPKLVVGTTIVVLTILFGLVGPLVVGNPSTVRNLGMTAPSGEFPLGTTQTGQDVLAQLTHATRGSLLIGLIVGSLTLLLSAFFGVVGAFIGGIVDDLFSLFTNIMLVIPGLPLVIIISSYVPKKSIWLVAFILSLTSWAGSARVLRGVTLSVRNRDYVLASRVSGEKTWRILTIEILPNLIPLLASQVVGAVIAGILGEAGLSFLGLGASGSFTWGTMLFYAQNGLALRLGAWWWFVPPGLMLALFGAALSMINYSIDETINPKLRAATDAKKRRRARKRSEPARNRIPQKVAA
ncbi:MULTISPECIES: ABC transporter permease [unclassified Actinomyces]|uniref:ABC transporter permease n=1 Tax=unclassified Actinomyces TaxID=2609248 RepID=UPI000D598734|nr:MULTISPECIES: ABC transporter permease [unclassified Actinomyces]RAX23703.1 ABC transporter permease [Actinomyces sp. Z3]